MIIRSPLSGTDFRLRIVETLSSPSRKIWCTSSLFAAQKPDELRHGRRLHYSCPQLDDLANSISISPAEAMKVVIATGKDP
jgi:hypothetical protein